MPKGPQGQKRPGDVVGTAIKVAKIATGEVSEDPPKNLHAVALGRLGGVKGGKARAKKLSTKQLSEIAKKAANARWKKK